MNQIERAARNHKIKQMALDGKTVDEIAAYFGMKRFRVQTILRSYKVMACKISHRLESEMAQNIITELKAGTRQVDIARKYGISRQYVNQVKTFYEEQE